MQVLSSEGLATLKNPVQDCTICKDYKIVTSPKYLIYVTRDVTCNHATADLSEYTDTRNFRKYTKIYI